MEKGNTELLSTEMGNRSFRDDCVMFTPSQMDFLPWDNPDNIVSAEVEAIVYRLNINILVFLFLIGGPANVINMVVFFKQGLQDRVNLCLFALALADELNLLNATIHHGEQLIIQFTTKEPYGPISTFLTNNHLGVLFSFCYISPILSAIIATERCLCVVSPFKSPTLLRTRTMAVIIIFAHILVGSLFSIVVFRYRIGCSYNPVTGVVIKTAIEPEFYIAHKELIDFLDSVIFGLGLPGVVMIVVTTTTMLTIVKLHQAVTWRSGTSSSISPRELALTKMLVSNSILFMIFMVPVALIPITWLVVPEMNAGSRYHNFYLCGVWIIELFYFINSTFNIFVYYPMGSRYRETFWALFGKKKTKPVKG